MTVVLLFPNLGKHLRLLNGQSRALQQPHSSSAGCEEDHARPWRIPCPSLWRCWALRLQPHKNLCPVLMHSHWLMSAKDSTKAGRQAMDQTQLRFQFTLTFLEKGLCPQEGPAWLGTLIPQGAVYGAEAFPGTT